MKCIFNLGDTERTGNITTYVVDSTITSLTPRPISPWPKQKKPLPRPRQICRHNDVPM